MYDIMFQVIHNESESESGSVVSNSLRPRELYSPWNSPGQNARVGSLSLLQGIFPTQGLNPSLLHYRRIPYQSTTWETPSFGVKWKSLSHSGLFATPWTVACQVPLSMGILQARILEWVAMPPSRGFFQPRDQTQVSRTAGGFFTSWDTREAQKCSTE